MASTKPVEEVSQDFTADLAALRDDVAKLTSSASEFIRAGTSKRSIMPGKKFPIRQAKRVAGASTELETTIERNPLMAVLVAMVAGILVGLLTGGRK